MAQLNLVSCYPSSQELALSVFDELLALLDTATNSDLPNHARGAAFEDFSEKLFGRVFKVVTRDFRTENGEIDLVLEIAGSGPWWADYGGDAFVECKNLNSGVPLHDVAAFVHKVSQARIRLGFVVSMSGFTSHAERTLRNSASNISQPLIVPLSGDKIRQALQRGDKLDQFLQGAVRDEKYLKY